MAFESIAMQLLFVEVAKYKSALIHYDINIHRRIIRFETRLSWRCICDSFCLISVFRSPLALGTSYAPLPPPGELSGKRSSETGGNFHAFELHVEAEMLMRGSGNEPAIRPEAQSF